MAREEVLLERPCHPGGLIAHSKGPGSRGCASRWYFGELLWISAPRARFPECPALLGWWTRRRWRLRPELGPLAPRRPELAPVAWRGRPRVWGSLPACTPHSLPASTVLGFPSAAAAALMAPCSCRGQVLRADLGHAKADEFFIAIHSAVDLKARRPLGQEPLRTGLCGGSPFPDRARY